MSEQQRMLAAVALSVAILLGWQFLAGRSRPPSPPPGAPAPLEEKSAAPAKPSAPAPAVAAAPAAELQGASRAPSVPETTKSFETSFLRGAVTNRAAALSGLELRGYDEQRAPGASVQDVSLVSTDSAGQPGQAAIQWSLGSSGPIALDWASGEGLVLTGETGTGVRLSIAVKPRADAYAIDYALDVENRSSAPVPVGAGMVLTLKPHMKVESSFLAPPSDMLRGLCAADGGIERVPATKLGEKPFASQGRAAWAGIDRQYFVLGVMAKNGTAGRCEMSAKGETIIVSYALSDETLAPGASWKRELTLFAGPKRQHDLAQGSPVFLDAIDYSIWGIPLGFLARPMLFTLNIFHGWTGSWGVAIMLLTLLVKLVLFPVTYKSTVSMRRMQLLKPELDRIKKQFENDRERQQLEQLKLFKERGVNPMGGCLPMLLQLPVWLALYRMLWTAVELYQQDFLWIGDLTAKEPFPFLALALGILTFVQQRLTPKAPDNQQAKVMLYLMPVMMTVFMIALPSGLVLYILANTVLTIVQQVAINRLQVTA